MRKCKFLSNPIYVDPNNLQKFVEEQYVKFIDDFVNNTTYFEGLPIIVKHLKDDNDYGSILNNPKYKETCFAHIVSKKVDQNSNARDLDVERLKTCHWVKELIDYYNQTKSNCEKCQNFYHKVLLQNGKKTTYIFCKNVRYVIVLQRINNYYIIKTAFYVNEEYSYRILIIQLL